MGGVARMLVVVAVALSVSTAARAAEIGSGPFAGILIPHSWVRVHYREPLSPGYERDPNLHGLRAGLAGGYDRRHHNLVFGIESDWEFRNLTQGADKKAINTYSAFEVQWIGRLRARAGRAFGPTLAFAEAGAAWTRATDDDTDPNWGEATRTYSGWTVGAGVERAMTGKVRARIEYVHDGYGAKSFDIGSSNPGDLPYGAKMDLTADVLRLGAFYTF